MTTVLAERALTSEETANLRTVDGLVPLWNRHDVSAILEHYDEEIRWRNVATGETYAGKAAVGAFLTELFAAVPDLAMEITRRVPHGRFVAEEYTLRGTHRGDLLGIPPTGRAVEVPAVSFVELRDARMLEDHFYFDVSTVLQQVGLFPPLSVARTPVGHRLMQLLVVARSPRRAWRLRRS
ncbi:MAG TPA: ester cyclase [Marmoricola sp.]|nr:ester cyclase [Marmoricola sp.]